IPAGYRAWGEGLFEKLEGMFAIGLFDLDSEKLILARDAAGIKPLYVSATEKFVSFASEVKALLEYPAQQRRIDLEGLYQFMAQGYAAPGKSLLEGVSQLPPGSVRVYSRQGVRQSVFWKPSRPGGITSMKDAVEGFEEIFSTVLDQMLVSDVPVGSLQSSGVDSSLIAMSLAGQGPKPQLFTARFAQSSHDESDKARLVAGLSGLRSQEVLMGQDHAPEETFRTMVRHFDGQLADSSGYSVYLLYKGIKPFAKVTLTGDGADEYFGGYPTYRATRIATWLQSITPASAARRAAGALFAANGAGEGRLPILEVAGRFFSGLAAPGGGGCHAYWRRLLGESLEDEILGPPLLGLKREGFHPLRDYCQLASMPEIELVDRLLLADQSYYLPSDMLLKVDAMSMAHGIEARLPFLDRRVMDFAGRLDSALLTPLLGPDKKILREALQKKGAPRSIVSQPKKGFNTPLAALLRTSLAGLGARYLDDEVERLYPFFAPSGIRAIWREHAAGRANHGYVLWSLLTFAIWSETLNG
ncbi:MAG: asparagine synthase-related protein, partial [Nitrospinota bacterium]|nr:asparagine synthase-related protein [Nitrospinota bacterium]